MPPDVSAPAARGRDTNDCAAEISELLKLAATRCYHVAMAMGVDEGNM